MLTKLTILFFFIVIARPYFVFSQINGGFESGLSGWMHSKTVSVDNANAKEGKLCAKMGAHSLLSQKIEISPLSVLQLNMYIKCSDLSVKAYPSVRFYNSGNRELLSYKSASISAITYQQTGNYVETPPDAAYMIITIERDSLETGYVYVDGLIVELNIGTPSVKHQPACNIDEYMHPFWNADTIYNETVLMYSINGKAATGKLLFNPGKILSVKSFDLAVYYKENTDYVIKDNTITQSVNSKMPFRADTSFDTKNNLAWYNLQSQWVVVTYTHKDKWNGPVPSYKGGSMPKTIAKLKSKSALKIVAYGMSITRGLDVSSYDTVAPYMPTYVDLFAHELKKIYRYDDITMYNAGLPGAIVSWGAMYADQYINPIKPDLVIIDFGMNDFWRYTPAEFKGYVQMIISKVKAANPNAEFLLLSNMNFDPAYILDSDKNKPFYTTNMQGYNPMLQQLETTGIIDLDMTTLSDFIYQRKKAKDCLVNPLHPNDYLARWYAQSMVALFH
jgi:lysophospholipase L1-like esterase